MGIIFTMKYPEYSKETAGNYPKMDGELDPRFQSARRAAKMGKLKSENRHLPDTCPTSSISNRALIAQSRRDRRGRQLILKSSSTTDTDGHGWGNTQAPTSNSQGNTKLPYPKGASWLPPKRWFLSGKWPCMGWARVGFQPHLGCFHAQSRLQAGTPPASRLPGRLCAGR
jgi:hypothetical protein